MKIACLGWGSLTWDPQKLPVVGQWEIDGPLLPIEFARKSSRGRITLVIVENYKCVPTLWTHLNCANLKDAKLSLAIREGLKENYHPNAIGSWSMMDNEAKGRCVDIISTWAMAKNLDAVVWTNLKHKFDGQLNVPSCEQVISYFRGLSGDDLKSAKEYVERAPVQVDTAYRASIERELGWIPI